MPLPYHAGKSKLAKTISKMVYKKAEENPSIKNYAEPFSGMGRVGIKVMEDDKNKVFKKYYFTDVNPTISVLFKALKKGWLPKLENITQEKWESYKKNKKPSAQKSFVGYTLGFGGQYFGGKNVRTEKRSHGGKNFAVNYMKSKKKYLKELQPYFKSSKFSYKEKSVFDLDFKDTIIYCDPPYVSTVFRAKKIWNKEKETKFWNTIKNWLEPSKNNIVILSNSKRTNKMKGLRVKKIYEDDVGYGSWKPNSKKRKEMIFEVVNTSGRKTRKKRGGKPPGVKDYTSDEDDDDDDEKIYPLNAGLILEDQQAILDLKRKLQKLSPLNPLNIIQRNNIRKKIKKIDDKNDSKYSGTDWDTRVKLTHIASNQPENIELTISGETKQKTIKQKIAALLKNNKVEEALLLRDWKKGAEEESPAETWKKLNKEYKLLSLPKNYRYYDDEDGRPSIVEERRKNRELELRERQKNIEGGKRRKKKTRKKREGKRKKKTRKK
jgi:site-specific DNA-adenine methylase